MHKPYWLWYVGHIIHNLGHNHVGVRKGLEEIEICYERWPFGKAYIYYRPHAHHPWSKMNMDEYKEFLGVTDDQ